jgi:CP family cyanate transporter-like MFS transporter
VRSLPGLPQLGTGTAPLGVAIAIVNVVLPALVKRDFPHHIGPVTGLYSAVQSVFAAIAAGVAVPIAGASDSGWRLAFGIWAGLAIIALGVFAPQLRLRSVPDEGDDADERGGADGDAARRSVLAPQVPTFGTRSPWRAALGWQVTLFMGLQSVCYYVLVTWLATIEHSDGIPAATAGLHQLLFNALGIAGSLASAALIPRSADQRLLAAIAPAFLLAAVLGLLFAPGLALIWACFAGVSCGGTIVLGLSMFGLRTSDHTQAAALSGMAQSVGYLLAAAGPLAIGALHDATGSWTSGLIALLVITVAQGVFGVLAARNRLIG